MSGFGELPFALYCSTVRIGEAEIRALAARLAVAEEAPEEVPLRAVAGAEALRGEWRGFSAAPGAQSVSSLSATPEEVPLRAARVAEAATSEQAAAWRSCCRMEV